MCNDFQVQKNLWIIISGVLQEDLLQAYNTLTAPKTVKGSIQCWKHATKYGGIYAKIFCYQQLTGGCGRVV